MKKIKQSSSLVDKVPLETRKLFAIHHYNQHVVKGTNNTTALNEAGVLVGVTARTVRSWSKEWEDNEYTIVESKKGKHTKVPWLLADQSLLQQANAWIADYKKKVRFSLFSFSSFFFLLSSFSFFFSFLFSFFFLFSFATNIAFFFFPRKSLLEYPPVNFLSMSISNYWQMLSKSVGQLRPKQQDSGSFVWALTILLSKLTKRNLLSANTKDVTRQEETWS